MIQPSAPVGGRPNVAAPAAAHSPSGQAGRDDLYALYDRAPVACAALTPDGGVAHANRACARLLGRPQAVLEGSPLAQFLADADRPLFTAWLRRVFESVSAPHCELRLSDAGGAMRKVRVEAERGPDGRLCHAALWPLADPPAAQSALHGIEARYARAVRGTSDGLWDWDMLTGEVFVSPRFEALLGFEPGELPPTVEALRSRIHPDDRARRDAAVQAQMACRTPYDIELRVRMKDGSYRWFRSRGQVEWNAQGEPRHMAGAISDISQKRSAEEALLDSEERFRLTFEQAAVGLAHVAPNGHWLLINRRLCDIVGYSADELKRLRFQDITHPDDLDADLAQVQRMLAGEIASYALEKRYLHKAGHVVWVELTVSLVRDATGAPRHFISIVNDVSARKQAQEALRESNRRVRSLVDANIIGVIVVDNRCIVEANDAFLRMVGYSRDELERQAIDWRGMTPPEFADADRRGIEETLARGECTPFEKAYFRKDGSRVPIVIGASLLSREPPTWVCFTLDITERVAARRALEAAHRELAKNERRLRAIIDTEPECVKVLAADGTLQEMNAAGLRMIEADSFQQVAQRCVYPLVVDEDRQAFRTLNETVFGGRSGHLEFRIVGLKGGRRWLETHAAPLRDDAGQVGAMLSVTRDITERKAAQGALVQTERRLSALVDSAMDAIVGFDEAQCIVLFNPAAEAMFGRSAAQMQGQPLARLLTDSEGASEADRLRRFAMPGSANTGALRSLTGLRQDGTAFPIEAALSQAEVAGQRLFTAILRDVTQRQRAEQLLRDNERLLSDAERLAHLGSWRWDFASREVRWSDEIYRLYGVTPQTFTPGGPQPETVHPDDTAPVKAWIAQCLSGQEPGALALRVLLPDGGVRTLETHGDLQRDADGTAVGMLGTTQDITERKRAEAALQEAAARYRRLFDANPHPMWVFDPQTLRFLAVNEAAILHYGYSRDEFLGMSLRDIRPAEDVPALLESARTHEGPLLSSPWRHRLKNGQLIAVEVSSQPFDFEGRPARVVLSHDVTAQRQASQQLLDSRESLRSLLQRLQRVQEDERTRIAREIHDELGQLLTSLKMDLRWLERKLSEPGLSPALNPLLERTVAASELNEQTIATVQRLAAGLRPGALDQLGLPAALAQRVRQFRQSSGVACTLEVVEPMPPLPQAMASELFYICQEALTNVTRHAHATRVTIRLQMESGGVRLDVEDDGVGIAPALLNAPHSLGLVGMQERARHCHGTVQLERAAVRGTRVVVRLPLAADGTEGAGA